MVHFVSFSQYLLRIDEFQAFKLSNLFLCVLWIGEVECHSVHVEARGKLEQVRLLLLWLSEAHREWHSCEVWP